MQNFIKLDAAIYELSCYQEKNLAMMLKTILPSIWREVATKTVVVSVIVILLEFPVHLSAFILVWDYPFSAVSEVFEILAMFVS